jgi:hypothetical protein
MNASNVHGDSYQYSYYRYEHRDEVDGAAPANG